MEASIIHGKAMWRRGGFACRRLQHAVCLPVSLVSSVPETVSPGCRDVHPASPCRVFVRVPAIELAFLARFHVQDVLCAQIG